MARLNIAPMLRGGDRFHRLPQTLATPIELGTAMLAFYINMTRDMDRRLFMEEQLSRVGLDAERIAAVTPDDLTDADRAEIRRIDAASSKTRAFCITLSHLKAMQALLASDAPQALIMEDDVMLSKRLPAFLAAFDASPPTADLLRIETSHHLLRLKPAEGTVLGFDICRAYSFEGGRAGYILTRHAAETIVSGRDVRRVPHDIAMFDPYQPLARRLRIRQLRPALIRQAQYRTDGNGPRFVDAPGHVWSLREVGWAAGARRVVAAIRRDTVIAAQKAWHQHVGGAQKQQVEFVEN